jgi:hypothetical protein
MFYSSEGNIPAVFESTCDFSEVSSGNSFELVFHIESLNVATGFYDLSFVLRDQPNGQIVIRTAQLMSISVVAHVDHRGLVTMGAQLSVNLLVSKVSISNK